MMQEVKLYQQAQGRLYGASKWIYEGVLYLACYFSGVKCLLVFLLDFKTLSL